MPVSAPTMLEALRARVRRHAADAYGPYSGRRAAALLLLSDGTLVPGVRTESASFSLVIPALVNAFSTSVALARTDVAAVVTDHALLPEEVAFLRDTPAGAFQPVDDDLAVQDPHAPLPTPGALLDPFLHRPAPSGPEEGVAWAREAAQRAHVPASHFPVGCVLELQDGRLVPGVNVEHSDWSRILCAERNALGTAVSYGLRDFRALYLTCPKDLTGSPCGACRQLLAELAPGVAVWMDRGAAAPEGTTPEALLPGSFVGAGLSRADASQVPAGHARSSHTR